MRARSTQPPAPRIYERPWAGFTLVELLVVIAIISLLAAICCPFASVRGKARETACLSNIRQAGLAIAMYTQDYDGYYPYAVDPADRDTPQIWNSSPAFQAHSTCPGCTKSFSPTSTAGAVPLPGRPRHRHRGLHGPGAGLPADLLRQARHELSLPHGDRRPPSVGGQLPGARRW